MYKSYSMELAGRTLTVDIGRVAKQANGAAFMHYGETVVPLKRRIRREAVFRRQDSGRLQQERGQGIRERRTDLTGH